MVLPISAMMFFEQDGADWWSTTYQKALLTLCFWSNRNYHNRIANQEQCRGNSTGCVYTLRSVLRGSCSLYAHFMDVYILQRGCFSVCLLARLWQASIDKQADVSTHVFYLQLAKVNNLFAQDVCGLLLKRDFKRKKRIRKYRVFDILD